MNPRSMPSQVKVDHPILAYLPRRLGAWAVPPRRCDAQELLDDPAQPLIAPAELAVNLRDIRRVNRFFGGTAIVLRHLPALLTDVPTTTEVTVLDLATGSADIPLALARWARQRGRRLRIVASDVSDAVLADAARQIVDEPMIELARFDARAVPVADGGFDIVLCSLALHHFPPDDATAVLREMDRLARRGFVVNDLARGRLGFAAAWLASRVTTRNRLTRHDAPLSVLRAYTPAEVTDLLARAGIDGAVVTRHAWFRLAAVRGERSKVKGQSGDAGSAR